MDFGTKNFIQGLKHFFESVKQLHNKRNCIVNSCQNKVYPSSEISQLRSK